MQVRLFLPAALALAAGAQAGDATSLASAIHDGSASVSVRYRYEFVDQDGFDENANASTARLRFNYATGAWSGWRAFGEFDYVGDILIDDYNSGAGTSPDKGAYPVVADPTGADLNQLYAEYRREGGVRLRFGRQRILLDNQRFVGGVGWRQNEQTYDAISVFADAADGIDVNYAWVANVNRIFGDTVPAGDERSNTHLLNARYTVNEHWHLGGYVYYLDGETTPSTSGLTVGIRAGGTLKPVNRPLTWNAEFARQSDAADAPVDYDADYFHVGITWQVTEALGIGAAIESLGGDDSRAGAAFRTPLATLHAFQGWADLFLATPDAGIVDAWLSADFATGRWTWQARWHDFGAESGGGDFGSELDVAASRRLGERYEILLKAAVFDSDDAAYPDTTKAWVVFTANW